jgi:hypothetical protein
VPKVPVGGPPTTKPATGAAKKPPPDPGPILLAVQADLTQLAAINNYKQAEDTVTTRRQDVTSAGAGVQSAQMVLTQAKRSQATVQVRANQAETKLRGLAMAAYMGLGYAIPGSGVSGLSGLSSGSVPGTVSTPGGLTGTEAADAQEMLRVVAQRDKQAVTTSRRALATAATTTSRASTGVTKAEAAVSRAENALISSQQTLAQVAEAATNPGVSAVGTTSDVTGGTAAGAGGSSSIAVPATRKAATVITTPTGDLATATVKPGDLPASPDILGPSVLTGAELAKWFASTGHKANTTVPITQLAADYQEAGAPTATGVRYDLAFAQSVVETGFFSFPSYGQLTPKDNNFAGIGACDSCSHGWSFPTAQVGVNAQLELLEAYASKKPIKAPDLRGTVGIGGCCQTWMALAGKWASSLAYGVSILTVYHQMLTWVIPYRELQAGLISSLPAAAAQGPTLAPLPKPAKTAASGVTAASVNSHAGR